MKHLLLALAVAACANDDLATGETTQDSLKSPFPAIRFGNTGVLGGIVLHVDSSANVPGNSCGREYACPTIQEALAVADGILSQLSVTILVEPGQYAAPIYIERPHTRLVANSGPVYTDGHVVAYHTPVIINGTSDDTVGMIGILADDVEVSGFAIFSDGGNGVTASGVREDAPFAQLGGFRIKDNLVANSFTAFHVLQANGSLTGNRAVGPVHVGAVVSGGAVAAGGSRVDIRDNSFEDGDAAGLCVVGSLDDRQEFFDGVTDGTPGQLLANISGNQLSANSVGLILWFRAAFPISVNPGTLVATITGNNIHDNSSMGFMVESGECAFSMSCVPFDPATVTATLTDNTIINNGQASGSTGEAEYRAFFTFNLDGVGTYMNDSTITIRTVNTDLGDINYDNPDGHGNRLIIDRQGYSGISSH
jgi:hypothetical protein